MNPIHDPHFWERGREIMTGHGAEVTDCGAVVIGPVQNATSIVDYCHRYWSGQPISSSPAESAANSLVNARMNKKRQMRWSPVGAHRVLQVRAAVADGRLKQAKLALAA